jgi:hypothetical protein
VEEPDVCVLRHPKAQADLDYSERCAGWNAGTHTRLWRSTQTSGSSTPHSFLWNEMRGVGMTRFLFDRRFYLIVVFT